MNSGWCDLRFSFFEGCAKFELRAHLDVCGVFGVKCELAVDVI